MKALLMTTAYVGILYLFKLSRPSLKVSRNDENVVKIRIILVTIVALASLFYSGHYNSHRQDYQNLSKIGADILFGLFLTASLYAAPLLNKIITWDFGIDWDIWALRDLIMGPVTEEIVFRAALIDTLSNWTYCKTIFLSPLYFGIAHVHHMYEKYIHNNNLIEVLIPSVFQFAFTSLFGWYASWLYLQRQSVISPIIAHMFCNFMGLPEWSIDSNSKVLSMLYKLLYLTGVSTFFFLIYYFT